MGLSVNGILLIFAGLRLARAARTEKQINPLAAALALCFFAFGLHETGDRYFRTVWDWAICAAVLMLVAVIESGFYEIRR